MSQWPSAKLLSCTWHFGWLKDCSHFVVSFAHMLSCFGGVYRLERCASKLCGFKMLQKSGPILEIPSEESTSISYPKKARQKTCLRHEFSDLDVLVRWFQSCRNVHPVPLGQWSNLTTIFSRTTDQRPVFFSCSKLSLYHVSQTCVLWVVPNIYVSQTCIYCESIIPRQFCWVKPSNFWTPQQITKMPLAICLLMHIDLEVPFTFYGYGGCGLYIYIYHIS